MPIDYSRLRALLAIMLLVVVGGTVVTFTAGKWVLASNAATVRQQDVIQSLTNLLSTLKDAETGQRGYLLTNDESYLKPYIEAVRSVEKNLADLRKQTDDEGPGGLDAAKLPGIEELTRKKLAELKETITLHDQKGNAAALEMVRSGQGKGTMDQVRTMIEGQLLLHKQALQQLRERVESATLVRTSTFVICGGAEVLFCIWAYRRILTEMRRYADASTELRRQKDLLSVTLGSIGDAVMVCDLESRLTFMNPVAEALTGWSLGEAKGMPLADIFRIINEESRLTVESPVEKVFRLGTVVGLANHTLLIRKDGSEVPIDDSGAPIRDEAGKIYGVVLVFRDFSEHKQAEHELLKAKSQAEAANRAKDQFLATLSHELRTPLTPVAATLAMWEAGSEIPAVLKGDVEMMRRNIDLEARLIDDLLDLTRITKGKLSLNIEPANLHDLLTSVVGMVRADAAARKIKIKLDLRSEHHFAEGDTARLQQVMWNLLKNAVKFTPEGGQIEVQTADEPGGRVAFRVKDSGVGFSNETFAKLFRPFEQGTDHAGRYGGLGLGLAIAKALVEAQGGTITAHSEGPGKGATFAVSLPATDAPAPGMTPEPTMGQLAARQFRILLVEDHADSAHALARIIASFGHDVHIAGSIAAAMQVFDARTFDVLVSDLGLPDGSGLDLVRQILAKRRIPAIALTGFGMEEDIARSRDAGFGAHLTKPVNFQKLESTLARILEEPVA